MEVLHWKDSMDNCDSALLAVGPVFHSIFKDCALNGRKFAICTDHLTTSEWSSSNMKTYTRWICMLSKREDGCRSPLRWTMNGKIQAVDSDRREQHKTCFLGKKHEHTMKHSGNCHSGAMAYCHDKLSKCIFHF